MLKFLLPVVFMLVIATGCITPGQDRPGEIGERPDALGEKRSSAILIFNEGNQSLLSAFNEDGEVNLERVDESIQLFRDSLRIDSTFAEPAKQIAIIYEFIKNDEAKALEYYKMYQSLSPDSIDESILYFIEKADSKSEDNDDESLEDEHEDDDEDEEDN